MKAKYIRVSSNDQNTERQHDQNLIMYIDKISGLTPFNKRPFGKKLLNDVKAKKINHITIHSVDRLGRNIIEIQNQLNWFFEHKTQIYIESIGINLLNEDKSINSISKMIIDLLGSIASIEIQAIKERQSQGIKIAKAKGNIYKGRKVGAKMSEQDYLKRHKDAISLLNDGLSISKVSKLTNKAYVTIKNVEKRINRTP